MTLTPAVVDVGDGDHVPFAWLELELNAVLLFLAGWFCFVAEYETRAHEVGMVAAAFARAEPEQVGLFDFDIGAADRVYTEPGGECEAVLVGPVADWR